MPLNSSLMVDASAPPWPRTRRHPGGTTPRPCSADSLCVGGAAWPAARILPTSPMANGRSSNGFCPSQNRMVSPANPRRNLVNAMLDILRGGRLATPAHEFSTWNTVLPLIPAMTAGSPLREPRASPSDRHHHGTGGGDVGAAHAHADHARQTAKYLGNPNVAQGR
jgi:hypothetical protein